MSTNSITATLPVSIKRDRIDAKLFAHITASFITLAVIALITINSPNCCAKQLPDLGSEARSVMPLKTEVIVGKVILGELRSMGKVSPDLIINSYLNHLGKRLALYANIKSYPINFFAIRDDSFNAFAFFGGNIGVHEGLITSTNSESELAAVMAHEVAHVAQEHLLRQIAIQRKLLPITMAEAVAAMAVGVPDLVLPILAGHSQQVINFTREHEQEADRIGIQILDNSGFDPQGMPNLFQNMSQKARFDERPPEYLLTHPLYENRISDARHRADNFHYQQSPSNLDYYLVKARIKALAESQANNDKIAYFEHQLSSNRYENYTACQYGYALTLAINHEYKKPLAIMQSLADKYQNNLIIQLGLVNVAIATGEIKTAIKVIEQLLPKFPDDLALINQYVEVLLVQKQAAPARKWLLELRAKYPEEPVVYYNLSRTESALGNQVGMYAANAEWRLLNADFRGAVYQLDLALQLTKDEYIKTKLKQRQKYIENFLVQYNKA